MSNLTIFSALLLQFVGELDILQGVIHAYDPDNLDQLSYSIIERGKP